MLDEGLNGADHRRFGDANLSESFDQGFAGFLQLGAVGLTGSRTLHTRGQTLAEGQHSLRSP